MIPALYTKLHTKLRRFSAQQFARREVLFGLHQPAVSITFDDFPRSALEVGGRVLEDEDVAGTFFCAFGLAETEAPVGRVGTVSDLANCVMRGHEIGCHTYSHRNCSTAVARDIDDDILRNQAAGRDLGLPPFRHFAYPGGGYSLAAKKTVMRHYLSARGTTWGINRGTIDLGLLKSVPLYSHFGSRKWDAYFKELSRQSGWLIFYTHDVSNNPSQYGCMQRDLEYVIRRARDLGAKVAPIGAVIDDLMAHQFVE